MVVGIMAKESNYDDRRSSPPFLGHHNNKSQVKNAAVVVSSSSSSQSNLSSERSRQEKHISLQIAIEPNKNSSSSSSRSTTSAGSQLAVLLFILLVDIFIVSHMFFNGSSGSPKFYFLFGVKKFYLEYPPHRSWTLAHAIIGVIPLILSLFQISSFSRKKSLDIHKNVGRLLIACGVIQIPTTIYMGVNWADKEVVDVMRALLVIFAFLWGLWGMAVLYYIRWKRNIDLHRQWAVRFSVISHFIPIFGRLLTVLIWFFYGQPEVEEGRIQALQTSIWTLVAIFIPCQEFFVWLESGKCWFHTPPSSRNIAFSSGDDDIVNQQNQDKDTVNKQEKWDDDAADSA